MAFTGYTIDDSIENVGGGAVLVPEGEYLLDITGCTPSAEDHDGMPYFTFPLKIADGPGGIGRTLRHNATTKADAQFGLGRILHAAGKDTVAAALKGKGAATYEQHKQLAAAIAKAVTGIRVGALLVVGSYNGRQRSEAYEFYPEADYADRSKNNALAQPVVTPGSNGVAAPGLVTQAAGAAAPAIDFAELDAIFKAEA